MFSVRYVQRRRRRVGDKDLPWSPVPEDHVCYLASNQEVCVITVVNAFWNRISLQGQEAYLFRHAQISLPIRDFRGKLLLLNLFHLFIYLFIHLLSPQILYPTVQREWSYIFLFELKFFFFFLLYLERKISIFLFCFVLLLPFFFFFHFFLPFFYHTFLAQLTLYGPARKDLKWSSVSGLLRFKSIASFIILY